MKKVILKIFLLFWICSFSGTLWSKPQHIILTGSPGTGSYIFADELSRLWASSRKTSKTKIEIGTENSPENRLTQLSNNRVSLAIIDAKSAHEELKKHPGLRVLSVLWKNWLYVLGTVPGPFLSLESTQTLLVHDNSLYFVQVWKKLAPQTEINWFNGRRIPDFADGFSEEVLAVSGPVPLREINNWLEQFAGIRLLALDQQLIRSLRLNYPWLMPHKLPANSFSYQSEALAGVAWNPVLVVRGDFPEGLATTLLRLIFSQKDALNPHILFQNLLRSDNVAFRKVYPYHSAAKKMFRFK
ncbi:MAG: hypothetical protein JKY07_12375 [SAR324 cluster bacterium]|nr:hypothetical protein [SAR324 cluster bacterium]